MGKLDMLSLQVDLHRGDEFVIFVGKSLPTTPGIKVTITDLIEVPALHDKCLDAAVDFIERISAGKTDEEVQQLTELYMDYPWVAYRYLDSSDVTTVHYMEAEMFLRHTISLEEAMYSTEGEGM